MKATAGQRERLVRESWLIMVVSVVVVVAEVFVEEEVVFRVL